jgi:DUF1680 family protein
MNKVQIRILSQKLQSFTLAPRIPPWARDMHVVCDGAEVKKSESANRLSLTRTWKCQTIVDIGFAAEILAVPWPSEHPHGVALFAGPLCLGLSADDEDLDRPQLSEPSGRIITGLRPISDLWLVPDVFDPIPRRVLFQTKAIK